MADNNGITHIIHKNNGKPNVSPQSGELEYGEIAINYASGNEGLFIRNSDDDVVKFTPGEGGSTGDAVFRNGEKVSETSLWKTSQSASWSQANNDSTLMTVKKFGTLFSGSGSVNISRNANGVMTFSATGGGSGSADWGSITNNPFSSITAIGSGLTNNGSKLSVSLGNGLSYNSVSAICLNLTAGDGIRIDALQNGIRISATGGAQSQPDWNITASTDSRLIKNKPFQTLGSGLTTDGTKLVAKTGSGITFNPSSALSTNLTGGNGVSISNSNGAAKITTKFGSGQEIGAVSIISELDTGSTKIPNGTAVSNAIRNSSQPKLLPGSGITITTGNTIYANIAAGDGIQVSSDSNNVITVSCTGGSISNVSLTGMTGNISNGTLYISAHTGTLHLTTYQGSGNVPPSERILYASQTLNTALQALELESYHNRTLIGNEVPTSDNHPGTFGQRFLDDTTGNQYIFTRTKGWVMLSGINVSDYAANEFPSGTMVFTEGSSSAKMYVADSNSNRWLEYIPNSVR